MDAIQNIAILLFAGTSFWAYFKLKQRLDLIEHEVRWVRHEIEDIKQSLFPTDAPTRK